MTMSKKVRENKNPQRWHAEEVKEIIKKYLNTDFTYNKLENKKERKIFQSGFWSGTQFRQNFENKRDKQLKEADIND